MNSLLIASFNDEASARRAMKRLDELALNGNLDLYERGLIRKTPDGVCEAFRESGSAGWETLSGALLGGLLGLIGGPVGSMIGMVSGAAAGSALSDRKQHNFGKVIRTIVENAIPPKKVAIVAHLGERSPILVDSILQRESSQWARRDLGKD